MDLLTDMETYFKGERDLALIMIPFGLAMVSLGYYLWLHYKGSFAHALMLTTLVVGIGLIIAGTFIMVKGGIDINKNIALIELDTVGFIATEIERVSNMNQTIWPTLKILWAMMIITSLGVIFFVNHEVVKGVTLAIFLGASIFMVIDILAEKRALIYEEKLRIAAK